MSDLLTGLDASHSFPVFWPDSECIKLYSNLISAILALLYIDHISEGKFGLPNTSTVTKTEQTFSMAGYFLILVYILALFASATSSYTIY